MILPRRYRLVDPGELHCAGDEFLNHDYQWKGVHLSKVGEPVEQGWIVRRREPLIASDEICKRQMLPVSMINEERYVQLDQPRLLSERSAYELALQLLVTVGVSW